MFKSVLPTATRALHTSNLTATRSFHTTLSRMGVTVDVSVDQAECRMVLAVAPLLPRLEPREENWEADMLLPLERI